MNTLEIACNSYRSCLNAVKGGADRIELFENVADGGCTPSAGMIQMAAKLPLPVYVMIRPRGGHFCYTEAEAEMMLYDIGICKSAGVAGIVFGCLTPQGAVDEALCKTLLQAWNGAATFHRAIDRSAEILQATKTICDLGFERILSSGGAPHAAVGLETLKRMQATYGEHIRIMPGAGVSPQNAAQILAFTGCSEIHATCKKTIASAEGCLNSAFNDTESVSDADEVRALRLAIDR